MSSKGAEMADDTQSLARIAMLEAALAERSRELGEARDQQNAVASVLQTAPPKTLCA